MGVRSRLVVSIKTVVSGGGGGGDDASGTFSIFTRAYRRERKEERERDDEGGL